MGPGFAALYIKRTVSCVKGSGESTDAEGRTTSFTYTAKYDGKDYPVIGTDLCDAISLKRINDHTVEATLKKTGTVQSKARRVVSKDGKTMTLTISGTTTKGEKTHAFAVYEKQ